MGADRDRLVRMSEWELVHDLINKDADKLRGEGVMIQVDELVRRFRIHPEPGDDLGNVAVGMLEKRGWEISEPGKGSFRATKGDQEVWVAVRCEHVDVRFFSDRPGRSVSVKQYPHVGRNEVNEQVIIAEREPYRPVGWWQRLHNGAKNVWNEVDVSALLEVIGSENLLK